MSIQLGPAVSLGGVGAGGAVVVVPDPTDATHLDDLVDVDTTGATPGDTLALSSAGPWRPARQSHRHEQITPATVWLVAHPLPFRPAGVDVRDHIGARHYPQVTHPDPSTVRLAFRREVRGTAHLS